MEKEKIWVSRYQIIKNKMLRGVSGEMLKYPSTIQKYMENLKSYNERKNVKGSITHFVTLEDIEKWNKNIEDKLKKNNNFNRYEEPKDTI